MLICTMHRYQSNHCIEFISLSQRDLAAVWRGVRWSTKAVERRID